MPVQVQAPDGSLVEFPDGTPDDVMSSAMRKTFGGPSQAQAATPQPTQEQPYTSSILPFSKDAQGEVSFDSNAGLLGTVKRAFMLPGDALAGNVDTLGQEGIDRAAEFAGIFGGLSRGNPVPTAPKAVTPVAPAPSQGMEAAAAANRLGVELPRAVASDNQIVQQGGKILSNVPIGGKPMVNASRNAIEQLGQAATRVQEGYGSGSIPAAGAAARESITGYATKTLPEKVTKAYDAVDGLVTQNVTSPLSETAKAALKIQAGRDNATLGPSSAVGVIQGAVGREGGLNYQGIKQLRTSVREMMDNPSIAPQGTSQNELQAIYSGLTADLKTAVSRGGGDKASKAFEEANQLAARTARERQALQRVLGKDVSDEKVFDKISSMAGSNSRADKVGLLRVRQAVGDDTWNEISSGVISKIGRDADGNFSPDRFITGYGKLSTDGKNTLFSGEKELASSLDDIAAVSRKFRQLNQYANPSGTAQNAAGIGYLGGVFLEPTSVVGSIVGAQVMSRVLAKPVSAKALANYSKAYEAAATAPSAKSLARLQGQSRVLSALIANETGDKGAVANIFQAISGVRQAPANNGNENANMPETQNGSVEQQPRQLLPNEL